MIGISHKNTLTLVQTLLIITILFLNGQPVKAQEATDDAQSLNVLKTNFLSLIQGPIIYTGEFRLVYERAVKDQHAIQVSASYLGPSYLLSIENDLRNSNVIGVNTQGYRGQFAYKYYIKHNAPRGFYFSPQFSYSYAKFEVKNDPFDYLEARYINGTLVFGYQLIAGNVFALDTFVGAGYKNNSWKFNDPEDSALNDIKSQIRNITGPKFVMGVNVGIAF